MRYLSGILLVTLGSVALAEVSKDKRVCTDWIDPFYEMMTLHEDRPATVNDLKRIFTLMDTNGNDLVSESEFEPPWRRYTAMTRTDSETLFAYWAIQKDTSDPIHINEANIEGVWQYFDPDNVGSVDQETFAKVWADSILPSLPDSGCSDGSQTMGDFRNMLGVHDWPIEYNRDIWTKVSQDKEVCNGWIHPFFEIMTLNEDRPATVGDLKRILILMDTDGNDLVSEPEFEPPWRTVTAMTKTDTETLFAYWAIQKDISDPIHINEMNIEGIWEYFDPDNTGSVDRETFAKVWTDTILQDLPDRGCSEGTQPGSNSHQLP